MQPPSAAPGSGPLYPCTIVKPVMDAAESAGPNAAARAARPASSVVRGAPARDARAVGRPRKVRLRLPVPE